MTCSEFLFSKAFFQMPLVHAAFQMPSQRSRMVYSPRRGPLFMQLSERPQQGSIFYAALQTSTMTTGLYCLCSFPDFNGRRLPEREPDVVSGFLESRIQGLDSRM